MIPANLIRVNTMANDALSFCVPKSPTTITMEVWDQYILHPPVGRYQIHTSFQSDGIVHIANTYLYFRKILQHAIG